MVDQLGVVPPGAFRNVYEYVSIPGFVDVNLMNSPSDDMIDCIVMYGGGLTSYEAAKRAINRFGRESVEIWFADTRMEDEDLYRFNRDVEKLLDHPIRVFSQGLDVWDIFHRERFLGNSRIDPCSKFLKRVPLRKALEDQYPNWSCIECNGDWTPRVNDRIEIVNLLKHKLVEPVCEKCFTLDDKYQRAVVNMRNCLEQYGPDSVQSRALIKSIEKRIERTSQEGRFVRVVLGMDIIEDCDRLHRASSYWKPFVNWFPLAEPPFLHKLNIIEELRSINIREPRLYRAGFAHNNCGGFCVKAGIGQMVHLLKEMPERYIMHENRELQFQRFIGRDVSILSQTIKGERHNLTLHNLRIRVEAGEEFSFTPGNACACLNPETPDYDEISAW